MCVSIIIYSVDLSLSSSYRSTLKLTQYIYKISLCSALHDHTSWQHQTWSHKLLKNIIIIMYSYSKEKPIHPFSRKFIVFTMNIDSLVHVLTKDHSTHFLGKTLLGSFLTMNSYMYVHPFYHSTHFKAVGYLLSCCMYCYTHSTHFREENNLGALTNRDRCNVKNC